VGQAFLKYMSITGVFADFDRHRKGFEKMHVRSGFSLLPLFDFDLLQSNRGIIPFVYGR
jgi:hypothetical protein